MNKPTSQVELASLEYADHAGWLYKQSSGFTKSWAKRWFVLVAETLYVFRSPKPAEVCRAVVALDQFTMVAHDRAFRKSRHCLVLKNSAYPTVLPLWLYAESATDLSQWLDVLTQHYAQDTVPSVNIVDLVLQRLDYQNQSRPSMSDDSGSVYSTHRGYSFGEPRSPPLDAASLHSQESLYASQDMGRRGYRSLQLPSISQATSGQRPTAEAVVAHGLQAMAVSTHHPNAPASTTPLATVSLSRVAPSPVVCAPLRDAADEASAVTKPKSPGPLANLKRRFSQSTPLDYEKYLQLMRARLHSQAQQSQSTADKAVALRRKAESEANRRLEELRQPIGPTPLAIVDYSPQL
ncbi:hypothetical protein H4R35_000206 [Dimargaris xerosporica]|nr:hypothetical protein H4R35_000206 [Dimargaris xerosporica]